MRVPQLYLDTSVIGGYFDDEWQEPTRELWSQMGAGGFRFLTSTITVQELEAAPTQVRELFSETFTAPEMLLDVSGEMEELATKYIGEAVLPPKYTDDARHVAVCVVSRMDYLVSWNFKHLVNVSRSDAFNAVNLLHGYPPVRIVNPLELIYGRQTQEL